jgi:ribosomal protein L34
MSLLYQYKRKGNKLKRHRKHWFLHRMSKPWWRAVINKRRSRGRNAIAVKKRFYWLRV